MLTRSADTFPVRRTPQRAQPQRVPTGTGRWTRRQAGVRGHLLVLEQATMAVLEGYLGSPLSHRAAHAAQQLLALAETLAWREGTRVAHEMVQLFHTTAPFGFVHAMQLSALTAAFSREMAQAAAGPTPAHGRTAIRDAPLHPARRHTGVGEQETRIGRRGSCDSVHETSRPHEGTCTHSAAGGRGTTTRSAGKPA